MTWEVAEGRYAAKRSWGVVRCASMCATALVTKVVLAAALSSMPKRCVGVELMAPRHQALH